MLKLKIDQLTLPCPTLKVNKYSQKDYVKLVDRKQKGKLVVCLINR